MLLVITKIYDNNFLFNEREHVYSSPKLLVQPLGKIWEHDKQLSLRMGIWGEVVQMNTHHLAGVLKMQTHHCICMINTGFMGSFLEGAACHWGGYMLKKSEEPTTKKGDQKNPFTVRALHVKKRGSPKHILHTGIKNMYKMPKTWHAIIIQTAEV